MLLAKYMGYKGGEGMDLKRRARRLLKEFKGDQYAFGRDTLDAVGSYARKYGKSVLVVSNKDSFAPFVQEIVEVLEKSGLELAGGRIFPAARPNAPREDVYRIGAIFCTINPTASSLLVAEGNRCCEGSECPGHPRSY